MHAHRRRPTIRRVRDWEPETAPLSIAASLRAPRVPMDLLPPPPSPSRDMLHTVPNVLPVLHDDDDEMEKATLARYMPLKSDVHEIGRDDPEETLAYIRKVQASIADPDAALDSLVAVYEDRVERLAKERVQAQAIVAQARTEHDKKPPIPRRATNARTKRTTKPLDRALVKLQPHLWKIVYSTICVWGLVQLALTR